MGCGCRPSLKRWAAARRRCASGWPASPPTASTGSATGPAPAASRASARPSAPKLIALARSTPPGRLVHDDAGELAAADPEGPTVWTLDALTAAARAAGIAIARSQVRRILLAEGVRWRQPRSWTTSADPEFGPQERGSWTTNDRE